LKSLRGTFSNYTPLAVSPATILKEVRHSKLKDKPPPLKTVEKFKNKYRDYHRDRGHSTNECIQLRYAIEKRIRQGRLRKYAQASPERRNQRRSLLSRNRAPRLPLRSRDQRTKNSHRFQSPGRNPESPPRGVIQVIARCSSLKGQMIERGPGMLETPAHRYLK
jgi:hypothetical protein